MVGATYNRFVPVALHGCYIHILIVTKRDDRVVARIDHAAYRVAAYSRFP